MNFRAKATEVTKVEADVLAVFAFQRTKEGFEFSEEAGKLDSVLGGILAQVAGAEDFEAKPGKFLLVHTHGKIAAGRVLLVGAGNPKELTISVWQTVSAGVGRRAREAGAKRLAVALPAEILEVLDTAKAGQGAVEGMVLGTYVFHKHKSEMNRAKDKVIGEVWLLVAPGRLNAATSGIERGEAVGQAVVFARDLVNEPPSVTTPTYLGEEAMALAKGKSAISCTVLGKTEMQALGMGALLGVARGSDEEPKFIKLIYRGGGRGTICLVGKGITFDSGGLSLKKASGMETMKLDMAGAAAILAVFAALSRLKPKVNVVGLIAATENMPSGGALKPGDVVSAMNGKTIEILNTDAEGRVILADALSFAAAKIKPEVIIDLATLTGACMVALGEEIAGLFASDPKLAKELVEAATQSGERLWELPLAEDYRELLKSEVADIKNVAKTRYGGAITAALFVQEFVPESTAWAHLDIAGPAWAEKDAPLTPVGATGYGVRLLLQYLLNR